jgi:threonine/homoserine/homoserine lactone efflux protein
VSILFIFTTAFVVGLSGAMMPGPLTTIVVRDSLKKGWRSGLLLSAGHGIAEIALLALFALGLNRLLHVQWISAAIGIAGGLVLLYMGADICRSALWGAVELDLGPEQGAAGLRAASYLPSLRSGIVATVANPYWELWWFTIGILYVTQALEAGVIGLGSFYTGHFLADLTWFMFVAVAAATGKRWMNPLAYRVVLGVCGVFLVGLAVYFVYSGAGAAMAL